MYFDYMDVCASHGHLVIIDTKKCIMLSEIGVMSGGDLSSPPFGAEPQAHCKR